MPHTYQVVRPRWSLLFYRRWRRSNLSCVTSGEGWSAIAQPDGKQLKTYYCSHRAIREIPETTPILFLSGAKDEVVPPSHMKALHELSCHGEDAKPTRTFVVFENGTHSA